MDTNIAIGCDDRNQVNSAEQGYFVVLTKGRNTAVEAVCGDVKFTQYQCSELINLPDHSACFCADIYDMLGITFDYAYIVDSTDDQLALVIGLSGSETIIKITSVEDSSKLQNFCLILHQVFASNDLFEEALYSQNQLKKMFQVTKYIDFTQINLGDLSLVDQTLNNLKRIVEELVYVFKSQYQIYPKI